MGRPPSPLAGEGPGVRGLAAQSRCWGKWSNTPHPNPLPQGERECCRRKGVAVVLPERPSGQLRPSARAMSAWSCGSSSASK